jgi:outer membrane protein TolC
LHEKEEQLHETQQRLHMVEEEKLEAEEKIRKLARRLLTIMGNEEISAETGLSLEEVQALREKQSV